MTTTKTTDMVHQRDRYNVYNLNNAAVSLIENGDFREAISHLESAVRSFKQVALARDSTITSDHVGDDVVFVDVEDAVDVDVTLDEVIINDSEKKKNRCHLRVPLLPPNYISSNDDEGDGKLDEEDSLVVYQKGILIPKSMKDLSSLKDWYLSEVSAVVLFNLALAHQLLATTSTCRSLGNNFSPIRVMAKATKLYELAFSSLQGINQGDEEVGPCVPEDMILFAIIATNNLALSYQVQGEITRANRCFHVLLSSIMLLTDCGDPRSSCWILDGFLRNMSHVTSPIRAAPAA